MKLFRITALALLLQAPLSHAGCNGYEDLPYERRNNYLAIYTSMIVAGVGFVGLGMRDIAKGANTLWSESSEAPLINNRETLKRAHGKIYNGLLGVGMGTAFTIMGFASMVGTEANARSNCCNALPSNSTCEWNK